jgi:predicted RNA-binding Zn-ribbon protein involved in translation (DUF1610 family)
MVQFAPGTTELVCPYCGATNEIAAERDLVGEQDLGAVLARAAAEAQADEQLTVHCNNCGAETSLKPNVTADRCPFCGAPVVAEGSCKKIIRPQGLLPFHVTKEQAAGAFRNWIAGLWFAPNELSRRAESAQIAGVYVPAWTYDAETVSDYEGQRGDDYWDTETYSAYENGRHVTRTRQVRKTRWRSVSGTVENSFDDLLVLASRSLPGKYAEALEPWDLKNLVAYQDEFLSGFVAESYQVGLPEGFEAAKGMMVPEIRRTIESDIGGDHQRISDVDTKYFDVTFKHLLLPIWISAYLYNGRTFRFLVNARTGEVQGERPYSWIKITLAILAALIVIGIVLLLTNGRR